MTPADVLRAALALLTPETWVNHVPDDGTECALTGIWAVDSSGLAGDPDDAPERYLIQALPEGYSAVDRYNDSLTDYAQLVDWFERAIKIAEEETADAQA